MTAAGSNFRSRREDRKLTLEQRVKLARCRVREKHASARLKLVDGYWRVVRSVPGLSYPEAISGDHLDPDLAWLQAERDVK